PFAQHSTGQINSAMAVNALAPMYLTHALLPQLGLQRPGRILTIASAAALVSNPNMSVYAASKAAAASFSDSLRLELEREPGRNLAVTTFCPTYVDTGMFAGARRMLFTPLLEKQQVADRAWDAMLRATPMVLLPWTSKLGQALRGVLPRAAWDLLAEKVLGIYHSMDDFSGRAPAADRSAQTPGNSAV
ncbi:SDR family NAD(P)-dependent oxidoreductase, partial [Glutamicibacter protophormiae]|uniref:SDR family NAD(P)-dependent oxidoreductase n=1 Tax=Glutamicibacter protophormiae TaxID=37930 RepID=UPI003BAF856B